MNCQGIYGLALAMSLVIGCGESALDGRNTREKAVAQPDGNSDNTSQNTPPSGTGSGDYRLGLRALDQSGLRAFAFDKSTAIHLKPDSSVTFANAEGKYLSYDGKLSSWSALGVSSDAFEYTSLYRFAEHGYVGIMDKVFTSRAGTGEIVRLPFNILGGTLVGVDVGFYASLQDNQINMIQAGPTGYAQVSIKNLPLNLLIAKPCVEGCKLWAYNGEKFYVLQTDNNWKAQIIRLGLPEGEKLVNLNLSLSYNGEATVKAAIAITESGKVFTKDEATSGTSPITWSQVLSLAQNYCLACHQDDGFGQEATWHTLKASLILHLQASPGTPGAMPPAGSSQAKLITSADRAVLLQWLSTITETAPPPPASTPPPSTTPQTLAAGALKTNSDMYCKSCHADAGLKDWWLARKQSASTRINSGNMPQGRTLDAATRTAFIDAINALN